MNISLLPNRVLVRILNDAALLPTMICYPADNADRWFFIHETSVLLVSNDFRADSADGGYVLRILR